MIRIAFLLAKWEANNSGAVQLSSARNLTILTRSSSVSVQTLDSVEGNQTCFIILRYILSTEHVN